MNRTVKVIELFAGVGGFRLGLEGWKGKSAISNYQKDWQSPYQIVWSNQWEPSTKTQHASQIYTNRWGNSHHCCEDINAVSIQKIPAHDLLVGGFPCQDYSVASTLKNAKGLIGKKGVLWWAIHRILSELPKKPKYLLLENVDRLLLSPAKQRGRDFAVMLQSLHQLGYAVEWRVINAADYGMPQRRRRIFLLGYLQTTTIYQQLLNSDRKNWLLALGPLATSFPAQQKINTLTKSLQLEGSLSTLSAQFNPKGVKGIFENTGLMVKGAIMTLKTLPTATDKVRPLAQILQKGSVPEEFFIAAEDIARWQYFKGAKSELRKKANGFEYYYKEGAMVFPDPLDRPSRTIITGEGGKGPSRFKHVIRTPNGLRRLTPLELERLNMFPDHHTRLEGVSNTKRAFLMGNALVVGVVEKIARELQQWI